MPVRFVYVQVEAFRDIRVVQARIDIQIKQTLTNFVFSLYDNSVVVQSSLFKTVDAFNKACRKEKKYVKTKILSRPFTAIRQGCAYGISDYK